MNPVDAAYWPLAVIVPLYLLLCFPETQALGKWCAKMLYNGPLSREGMQTVWATWGIFALVCIKSAIDHPYRSDYREGAVVLSLNLLLILGLQSLFLLVDERDKVHLSTLARQGLLTGERIQNSKHQGIIPAPNSIPIGVPAISTGIVPGSRTSTRTNAPTTSSSVPNHMGQPAGNQAHYEMSQSRVCSHVGVTHAVGMPEKLDKECSMKRLRSWASSRCLIVDTQIEDQEVQWWVYQHIKYEATEDYDGVEYNETGTDIEGGYVELRMGEQVILDVDTDTDLPDIYPGCEFNQHPDPGYCFGMNLATGEKVWIPFAILRRID